MRHPVLLACSCAAAVAAVPQDALACLAYFCEHPYFAPPNETVAPANAALAFRPFWSDDPTAHPRTLSIHQQDGGGRWDVGFTVREDPGVPGVLNVRLAEARPGTYYATFGNYECPAGVPDEPVNWIVRFEVGPEAPPPTSAGTVTVGERVREPVAVDAAASCFVEVDAAARAIRFVPSAELAPWLPVARLTLLVDDVVWATTGYGGASPSSSDYAPHRVTSVFTVCDDANTEVRDRGLVPGVHRGELRVRLAGEPADLPPIPFEFWIGCGDEPGTGGTGGDGGFGGWGGYGGCGAGGFGGYGGPDGGGGNDADPDAPGGPGADAAGCGCATPGSSASGLGLLLVALLARRRR